MKRIIPFFIFFIIILIFAHSQDNNKLFFDNNIYEDDSGSQEELLENINKAIMLHPENDYYYNKRGYLYYRMGMYKEAVDDFTKSIKLNPKDFYIYLSRGDMYYRLKMYHEALSDYTNALEINTDDNEVYNILLNRIVINCLLENSDKIIEDVNRALPIAKDKFEYLYFCRTIAYMIEKDYEKALADINQAISYNSKETGYLDIRAQIYEVLAAKAIKKSVKNEYSNRARRDRTTAERLRNTE